MVHHVMIKVLALVVFVPFMILGQSKKVYQVNQISIDTSFNYSDHHYNFYVVKDSAELLIQYAKRRNQLFDKLHISFQNIGIVQGTLLSDGSWGGGHIKNTMLLNPENKTLEFTFHDYQSDVVIKVDFDGNVNAKLLPKSSDRKLGFSGELLPERPTREFNECYLFLSYDPLYEFNHPKFSLQKMNRILEGYALLIEKDEWGSHYAYKLVFRGFIEVKGEGTWKLIKDE